MQTVTLMQRDYVAEWEFARSGILNSKACINGYVQAFCSDWENVYSRLSTKSDGTQLGELQVHKSGPNEKNS